MTLQHSLALVEQWPLVRMLATSDWGYPLVSTLHLLGIALLIGSIAPVDLRLLGCWRADFGPGIMHRLRRIAAAGLLLAMLSGSALFMVRASEYVENPWLLAKWALLLAAVSNALLLGWRMRRGHAGFDSLHARAAGALSLLLWLGALTCGRWIAFA